MRWTMAAVVVLLVVCQVQARQMQEERRRTQVAAATASAVQALYDAVSRQDLSRTHTVADFLDQAGGREELIKTLQRAEQIGGPRWIDEQTCQVQLEISGEEVARALAQIAAANPARSPVSGEELVQRLREWDERTFSATGTSTCPDRVEQLRPSPGNEPWSGVSDGGRRAAVAQALDRAVAQTVENVRLLRLHEEMTVGEAVDQWASADEALEAWVSEQPVTGVQFREDLQVELTVVVPSGPLVEAMRSILEEHTPLAVEQVDWEAFQERVEQQVVDGVGHGRVPQNGTLPRLASAVELPREAPVWVADEIQADAVAAFTETKLHTARAAESEAMEKLQQEVRELPLSEHLTLGEAAERDPNVRASLERALARADVAPPDYNYGGGDDVRVRVSLSLRNVWEELRGQP